METLLLVNCLLGFHDICGHTLIAAAGFTTFSTFAVDVVGMIEAGQAGSAAAYVLVTAHALHSVNVVRASTCASVCCQLHRSVDAARAA